MNSQTPLGDTCKVPCHTLITALQINNQKQYLEKQILFARDTIQTYSEIILSKDSIILAKDSSIGVYQRTETNLNNVIQQKDNIIITYKNSIKTAYTITGITVVTAILILLL